MRCDAMQTKAQRPKKTIEGPLALTPTLMTPDTTQPHTHTPPLVHFCTQHGRPTGALPPGDLPAFSHFVPIYLSLPLVSFLFLVKVKAGQHAFFLFLVVSVSDFSFSILCSLARRFRRSYHYKKNPCLLRFVHVGGSSGSPYFPSLSPVDFGGLLHYALPVQSEKRKRRRMNFTTNGRRRRRRRRRKRCKVILLAREEEDAFSFFLLIPKKWTTLEKSTVYSAFSFSSPLFASSFLRPSAR
jgi:hypothetical protein